jgi:hypothetical protein
MIDSDEDDDWNNDSKFLGINSEQDSKERRIEMTELDGKGVNSDVESESETQLDEDDKQERNNDMVQEQELEYEFERWIQSASEENKSVNTEKKIYNDLFHRKFTTKLKLQENFINQETGELI